jgi:hypothetical protein
MTYYLAIIYIILFCFEAQSQRTQDISNILSIRNDSLVIQNPSPEFSAVLNRLSSIIHMPVKENVERDQRFLLDRKWLKEDSLFYNSYSKETMVIIDFALRNMNTWTYDRYAHRICFLMSVPLTENFKDSISIRYFKRVDRLNIHFISKTQFANPSDALLNVLSKIKLPTFKEIIAYYSMIFNQRGSYDNEFLTIYDRYPTQTLVRLDSLNFQAYHRFYPQIYGEGNKVEYVDIEGVLFIPPTPN